MERRVRDGCSTYWRAGGRSAAVLHGPAARQSLDCSGGCGRSPARFRAPARAPRRSGGARRARTAGQMVLRTAARRPPAAGPPGSRLQRGGPRVPAAGAHAARRCLSSGPPVPGMAASCCPSSGSVACGRRPAAGRGRARRPARTGPPPAACARRREQRPDERPGLLFVAGRKEALADGLERVGDAQRVLAGDLIVRVQAEPDIFCPELPRFRQQGHDRRGHLPVLGRQRPAPCGSAGRRSPGSCP